MSTASTTTDPGLGWDGLPLSRKQVYSIVESNYRMNLWQGSIRSGKTFASIVKWFIFLTNPPKGGQLVMVGRTRDSIARNVIDPMQDPNLFGDMAQHVHYVSGAPSAMMFGRKVYIMGASDSAAEKTLRGLTVSGAYVDELTVIREDFFTQLLGRMSVPGAQCFATTNPDSPYHWLKVNYLDRLEELPDWGAWHFTLDDNPSLTIAYKNSIKSEYTGLWYRRFVLGEWVSAEGSVYDMWDPEKHVVRWEDLPDMAEYLSVGIDYGTTNATSAILVGVGVDNVLYLVDEWRYTPRSDAARLTDGDLSARIRAWINEPHHPRDTDPPYGVPLVVDPAAASFRVQMMADGAQTYPADNNVLYGIRTLSTLLGAGRLKVSDRCPGFITEVPGYSWDQKATNEGHDSVIKVNDHSLDAGRYGVLTTEKRWRRYMPALAQA